MANVVVLIPVYQELEWLSDGFGSQWAFLSELPRSVLEHFVFRFCIWESSTEAPLVVALKKALRSWPAYAKYELVCGSGGPPSVVASLRLGLKPETSGSFLLVCPIDCSPGREGLCETLAFVKLGSQGRWAYFPKRYDRGGLMRLSAFFQNTFVLPVLGVVCWTNLFLVPAAAFDGNFQRGFFLEDLRANKSLRRSLRSPHRFKTKALVSARRYKKRGPFRQMVWNVTIFVRYLFGAFDETLLRGVHEGGPLVSESPKSRV